ncbi:MAG TPA: HlyD family efflux transporter periplasmic adaptor subunit [Bryobacteraceae bacterium]|jgi:HlyD family secretion protein|nr:HlyD family efflux transporter periplasmic adaptor subunit [Bryobacteraceae bacterium]
MDVPRGKEVARKKLIRRIALIAVVVAAIPLITWLLSRLKPAAPSVDRATVWIDSVKRGPMLREVRGLGTLVVEEYNWIPAQFESRVEKLNFLPGAKLHPSDVIMILKNPQMEQDVADLDAQIKQAQSVYDNLKVTLETARLAQEAITEQVQSDMNQAALQADRDKQLNKLDLKSDIDAQLSAAKWEDLKKRYDLSKKQLDINNESVKAQLENQRVAIANLNEKYKLKKSQVEELTIRAGVEGTLQQLGTTALPLEQGMRVQPGTILAKIAQPNRLKATLKIPETQAKDVAIGQVAQIDTRNGVIPGHVTRIDPASTNGTVDVDVKLEGRADGMRPDLSVDGNITIERLADVVYVGRPVIGQPNAKITLFKLDPDGKEAQRVPVTLGVSSVNTIQVMAGLKVGDQVVLSDMSAQDAYNRIRLN